MKRAVFLDRDGVLNIEVGYIHKVEDLHLIPGIAQAVRRLNDKEIFCCLVSNQSGPARDYNPISHVEALHKRLCQLLENEAGARLDALYYCPYLSAAEGGTNPEFTRYSICRIVLWSGIKRLMLIWLNAGCTGILVQTGYGKSVLSGEYQHHTKPDFITANLATAVEWILQHFD